MNSCNFVQDQYKSMKGTYSFANRGIVCVKLAGTKNCLAHDEELNTLVALNVANVFFYCYEIYEYYEAQSAISLFQMNEFFSQRFRDFKLEYLIHATYAIPLVFPIFLTGAYRSF